MKRSKPDSKQISMFNFISNSDENNNSVYQIDNSPDQADIPDEDFFLHSTSLLDDRKKLSVNRNFTEKPFWIRWFKACPLLEEQEGKMFCKLCISERKNNFQH